MDDSARHAVDQSGAGHGIAMSPVDVDMTGTTGYGSGYDD